MAHNHYTLITELFTNHFQGRDITGIEIGTGSGNVTYTMMHLLKNIKKLYSIDPWKHRDGSEYEAFFPQDVLDKSRELAFKRLNEFSDRLFIFPFRSDDAFELLKNQKFDFVWIDGDHTQSQVKRDLANYSQLINIGGIIGGHDYNILDMVLKEFFGEDKVNSGVDLTWWVFK